MELRKIDRPAVTAEKMENRGHGRNPFMDFEVFFRLKNTELARYQFAVETPTDIQAGFINALEAFRVQRSIRVPTASLCVESLNALPST